jgi:hypothetical protein
MGFDRRDIRRGMDVYTRDNTYLGNVLEVITGPAMEQRVRVSPDARQSSSMSGELRGPMPTLPLGNRGPINQSARADYATLPDAADLIGAGTLVVGKWWGLRGRRTLSLKLVQSVSLERVALVLKWAELP